MSKTGSENWHRASGAGAINLLKYASFRQLIAPEPAEFR
jgi:hypothetical protein